MYLRNCGIVSFAADLILCFIFKYFLDAETSTFFSVINMLILFILLQASHALNCSNLFNYHILWTLANSVLYSIQITLLTGHEYSINKFFVGLTFCIVFYCSDYYRPALKCNVSQKYDVFTFGSIKEISLAIWILSLNMLDFRISIV